MYKEFYHLKRNPFEITPDPAFLFPTTGHNEALASLYYGVTCHRGFVVLTGEVGTGKTLLVRSLLSLLQRRDVAFALIFNPSLTALEFIRSVTRDFGLPVAHKAKDEMLHVLNEFLLDRHKKKLTTLLVVDEAHHLSSEVLEEIRLLTNLETSEHKLLQIVMAGQPELDHKLDSFELRQLKQRIALRCQLESLKREECKQYILRRLAIAGALSAPPIFSAPAMESVFRESKGVPRLVNTICENSLMAGYARNASLITSEIVEDIANDLRLGIITRPTSDAPTTLQGEDTTLVSAARTLLELSERLKAEAKGLPSSDLNRPTKHEPYI